MSESADSETTSSHPEVTMEQLVDLRTKTEAVSQSLREHVTSFINTLRPLMAPIGLLGEHVRGGTRDDADHGDETFEEVKQRFSTHAGKPFSLPKELKIDPISVEGRLELYPWEYSHTVTDASGEKVITMTCPLKWILVYRSGYTPSELRKLLLAQENRRAEDVRQFLTSAITLNMMLDSKPEIVNLLSELRYKVQIETAPGFGNLPLVTINACLPSFRPSDELIKTATGFSGVAAFIELLDLDAIARINDPMKERIEAIV